MQLLTTLMLMLCVLTPDQAMLVKEKPLTPSLEDKLIQTIKMVSHAGADRLSPFYLHGINVVWS